MGNVVRFTLVFLLLAAPAIAEENPLRWKGHEGKANRISDILVAGVITADIIDSWRADDRKEAFAQQACGMGSLLAVEALKHSVNRLRPDKSDNLSFPSGHTAAVGASSFGWRFAVAIPLTVGTGGLRMGANKHFATDTLAGAAIGITTRLLCEKIGN